MSKFLSDEFFGELQGALSSDPKWTEAMRGMKTTILMGITDTGSNFMITVDGGATTIQKSGKGASAEFSFEGSYEAWTKVAKGELDMQSAVLKGLPKEY